MYITKKDLLNKTGISYGQLYRWKREGLIPEEWFQKRSSPTGQETYLPKELILERIAFIQKHKKDTSLEILADILRMKGKKKEFDKDSLRVMNEIHPDIAKVVKDGEYSRAEVAFLTMISDLYRERKINRNEVGDLLMGCAGYFGDWEEGRHMFFVYRLFGKTFGIIAAEGQKLFVDTRAQEVAVYQIEETASKLAVKYLKREG